MKESSHQQLNARVVELEAKLEEYRTVIDALWEKEQKYRILAENSNDVIWTVDLDLKPTYVSPAVYRVRGLTQKEAMQQSLHEMVTPDSMVRVLEKFQSSLEGEEQGNRITEPIVMELEYYCKDGSTVWVENNISPIRNDTGEIIGVFGISRDISERKKAGRELLESERKLARARRMESIAVLAGGVAHDLNNILAGILSFPDMLLMDLPVDSPLHQSLATIRDAGERAADIVADLLTIARGVAINKEVVDLNELVQEYCHSPEHLKIKESFSDILFRFAPDATLWHITCSPTHIKKALMNLVINAAEAVTDKGMVTIITANRDLKTPLNGYDTIPEGKYVTLIVTDSGSGIAEDDMEHIFEPFYTKKVMGRSGTGLGLAVIRNTAREHDGFINVTTGPAGSTFALYLPATDQPLPRKKPAAVNEHYMGNGEKILVVDDEPTQREVASALLEKLGYTVKAVSSGEDAVSYMVHQPVDLVLLDMLMGDGMNGRETYERLLTINPRQKAIITSGFSKTDEVEKAIAAGPAGFLQKPYSVTAIGRLIRHQLKH
ncbi:MAG: PAS domain S-box protein [Thermodesulfobacteriota bacterium]|nr:PAS domain S-box protein [Thermodesulfobacteriota bacterium]